MAKTSKSKASTWYGYLKAGARSSAVLRDNRLDTGNPNTFYMFNLSRGAILEYAREIVEKKLRELKPDESGFIKELDAGYKKARRNFKDRGAAVRSIVKRAARKSPDEKKQVEDSEVITEDSDVWANTPEADSDLSYG